MIINTVWKVSKYGVFSGLYFLVFGLNTEIYFVNLRIQSECGKILPLVVQCKIFSVMSAQARNY